VKNQNKRRFLPALLACLVQFGCSYPAQTNIIQGEYINIQASRHVPHADDILSFSERRTAYVAGELRIENPRLELSILLFDSARGMRRYLTQHCPQEAGKAAACYFSAGGYVLTLVRGEEEDVRRTLTHELTHYVLASTYYDFPPWIDEGLAQFFEYDGEEAAYAMGEKVLSLSGEKPGMLDNMLSVPAGEELSLDQYALSWGLVNFLVMNEAYGGVPALKCYLERVTLGKERALFKDCFGHDPEDIEPVMRSYYLH
jgi:hypothetical protein